MDEKTRLLTARVLHSKLAELDPPESVTRSIGAWLHELENRVRAQATVGFAETVGVADGADVQLVNMKGLKQ